MIPATAEVVRLVTHFPSAAAQPLPDRFVLTLRKVGKSFQALAETSEPEVRVLVERATGAQALLDVLSVTLKALGGGR